MSLSECIKGLIAEGAIPKAQGEKAEAIYSRQFNRLKHGKSMMAAAAEASEATLAHLRGEAKAAKRAKISTAMAQVNALADMKTYAGGALTKDGLIDPRSLTALAVWDDRARFMDLEGQHDALRATYHATLDDLLRQNRATVLGGQRDPALEADILAAAYGEKVENQSAIEMATAAKQVAELARAQFNEAGGHIGKREDWHWPQDHSADKLEAAGFDVWKARILGDNPLGRPYLKFASMIDNESGLPFEPEGPEFDALLRDMYRDVITDGLASMEPGAGGMGKSLGNRHAEERFFVFSDSASHLAYSDEFGKTGVFEGMMRHLDRMARDNAAIQRFGANPAATIRMLGDTLVQQAAKATGYEPRPGRKWYEPRRSTPTDRAQAAAEQLRETYEVYMGSHQNMIPKNRAIAAGFDAFRSYEVASKLGGAYISAAPGDMATASVTRSFNGLPQAKMIPEYLKLIAPTSASLEERQMLIRHGAMAADWAQSGAEAHRLMGEQAEGEVMKRVSDVTLRLSALSKHTDVARQLYVKGTNAGMIEFRDMPFDQLPPKFAAGIDRYGIGPAEWDRIRSTELVLAHGTLWFDPMRIEDGKVREAYLRMVHTEKRFAVPEVDLRTKTMLASNLRRGDFLGESLKTLFLFKGFGLTLVNTHGRRAMGRSGMAGARFFAAYAVRMGILTTLAGAVSLQIRNMMRGQDPEPMDDSSFVGRAVAQGGGFGIFGDFLKTSENRFGGGFATTLAGPGVQTAQNFGDLTVGNAMKAGRGEKLDLGKDIVKIMRQEVPVASSLWYLRPAYDRLLVDEMDALANPDHEQQQEALMRRMAEQGKPFYAPPGSGPGSWRAPDFGNAIGRPSAPENVARREAEAAAAEQAPAP